MLLSYLRTIYATLISHEQKHMSKREEYNLAFYKIKDPDGGFIYSCEAKGNGNPYGMLYFLSTLSTREVKHFIDTITLIKSSQPYDPDFMYTDGTEWLVLEFENPNFIIEQTLTIHMDDLNSLMEEWLTFIQV